MRKLTVMGQTGTKPKKTKFPQWLEEEAKKTGLPLLTDVHRTGEERGRGRSSVVEEVVYNGEVCAMKVPASSHKKYMLLEEAEILATLKHLHIMKLIGVTVTGHYRLMSLVLEKGTTTLTQFLSFFQKKAISLRLKLQILQQACGAVQYLHTQEPPIVHSDITGTNIFLVLVERIKQIRTALGISNKLVTVEDLNLPFSEPTSVPRQRTADSFKDLHQFKLDDVHQTGVELGGGSFSVVYEVEWGQRRCAAKHFVVFGHTPEATNQIAQSLVCECKHWLELKHPHIVETLGWYEKDTSPFPIIVMEKMDMSLKNHLVSCNKEQFPFLDKIGILFQVATGIEFLHTRSSPLVHGDITANNVLLTGCPPHCAAKLADFGLTRVFDMMSITSQSVGSGTYAYISPEFFIQPPAITEKMDNFCFGILLIHTITHNYPFPSAPARFNGGDQPLKALTELERRQQYIGLFTLQERHCLEDIIRPCLEQDPEERPTSTVILRQMAAVKETLVAQLEGPFQEMPPSFSEHPMAKRRALSVATVEEAPPQVQIVDAIKPLSADYESRFTADWCISIIRAEEVLSEYAVTDIEAIEHPIKRTAKLFHYLQQVEFENVKRFCLSIIHNSAFPPGTPEHEFARSLLIKIEPKPQNSDTA